MNPITAARKYFKSKPILDEMQKEFTTMNPSNWRTNIHAVAIGALMLASIWAPLQWQDKIQKTQMALVVSGLLTSADAANLKKQ